MPITLTQLAAFLAVVRNGSVTAAADELVVTQPSVSAALSALSREVGVELTEKVGRSVRLTAGGGAFAPFATDVLGLLEQGKRAAHEAAGRAAHQVSIAAVTTAGEFIAPPLLHAFAARHPEVALTLEVGNRHRVMRRVLEHEADIGIGGRPPAGGGLVGRPFLRNEIVLIAAADDPLVQRRSVPLDELEQRTWLLREQGSGTRTMVEEFLVHHELRPPTLTLGSNGAIKQAARLGLGVSLQSRVAVDLELASGVLGTVPIGEALPDRDWYALRSARGRLRPSVAEFVAFAASDAGREAVEAAQRGWALRPRRSPPRP